MEPHEEDAVVLEKFGIRTHSALKKRMDDAPAEYLIEDLISQPSLTLAVGDSGIGKSPLIYQALLCVSAGIPFLGRKCRKGRTMYMDCENGVTEVEAMAGQLAKHLRLPEVPKDNFLLWNLNDCPEEWGSAGCQMEDAIIAAKPDLVVLDPLNAMFKGIESDNTAANLAYLGLRKLMKKVGCSFICVHHPRKFDPMHITRDQSLESGDIHRWFDNARGPRVLINGSDLRLGIEPAVSLTDGQLVVGGFRRVHGEIPMMRICRVLDDEGEPAGYSLMRADDLLPPEQKKAFASLEEEFSFKDAMRVYGKQNQATSDFLKKLRMAGLLKQVGRGRYKKIDLQADAAAPVAVPQAA